MNNWYKLSKKTKHNYSWVFLNLPEDIQKKVISFGQEIDPEDLYKKEAEDGLELDPHITVKYGLLTEDYKDAKDIIDNEKGGKVYLGKSTIFANDKFDVVKIDVESKDLERLHNKLNALQHEDSHPEFHAHATIAYVKKGKGKKYVGKFEINKEFKFKEVFFGDKEENHKKIKLSFNLMQMIKKAQIWNFVDEEYPVEEGDEPEFESVLKMMYEMEYKYSMLKTRPFAGNEVRRENILQKLQEVLNEACDKIIFQLKETIAKWLKGHALTNPQEWAGEILNEVERRAYGIYDVPDMMVEAYRAWGDTSEKNKYKTLSPAEKENIFSNMIQTAFQNLNSFPSFKQYLDLAFIDYKESLYSQSLEDINSSFDKNFKNEKQAQNFINSLSVDNLGPESLGIYDISSLNNMNEGLLEPILKEFYAYFVFPLWFKYWSERGIERTRELIENSFAELAKVNTVEEKVAAISQALNLYHQTGKMLEYLEDDVGSNNLEATLNRLTEGIDFVEKSNKELKEIGVQLEDSSKKAKKVQTPKKTTKKKNGEPVEADISIEDLQHKISNNINWYKVSGVVKEKLQMKPYRVVKIVSDIEQPIEKLQNERVYAYSQEQARLKFFRKFDWLRDYLSIGQEIEARLDKDLFERELAKKKEDAKNLQSFKEQRSLKNKEVAEDDNVWWKR